MSVPSESGSSRTTAIACAAIAVVVVLAIAITAVMLGSTSNNTDSRNRPPSSAQGRSESIDYAALKRAAKGGPAEGCVDEKRLPRYYVWIYECVRDTASAMLVAPNERIEQSAPMPYSTDATKFLIRKDSAPNGQSSAKQATLAALQQINALEGAIPAAEKKAIAARMAQWKAWNGKWGNPPADKVVAKHVRTLKAQMDREGVDGEQKLIQGVYCGSTNDRKVLAAQIVLVNELIADGAKPGVAANTVLVKLDNLSCRPARSDENPPSRSVDGHKEYRSGSSWNNDGPR